MTLDSSHFGGLLSMSNSTKELFVVAKVFRITMAIFLPNGFDRSRYENTTGLDRP